MSSIAAIAGVVCVCAVAVSALSVISPNGMTSKTLSLVVGAFMVCVMIVPVKSFVTDFKLDIQNPELPQNISSQAQEAYNHALISETEARIEKTLLASLISKGYSAKKAEIELSINEDGGIYISRVSIYIDRTETRVSGIIHITEEELSITPCVIAR